MCFQGARRKRCKLQLGGIGRERRRSRKVCFYKLCSTTANLLDPLDPDAVIADVQVVEDVGWLVLPEHSVNLQQASEDAGLPWAHQQKQQVLIWKCIYFSPGGRRLAGDDGLPKTCVHYSICSKKEKKKAEQRDHSELHRNLIHTVKTRLLKKRVRQKQKRKKSPKETSLFLTLPPVNLPLDLFSFFSLFHFFFFFFLDQRCFLSKGGTVFLIRFLFLTISPLPFLSSDGSCSAASLRTFWAESQSAVLVIWRSRESRSTGKNGSAPPGAFFIRFSFVFLEQVPLHHNANRKTSAPDKTISIGMVLKDLVPGWWPQPPLSQSHYKPNQ